MTHATYDALVVGGGLHGLASAFHLRRLGLRSIVVLERFRLGHDRGSSHGKARITRSSYGSEVYARLMRVVNDEEWPRLERAIGRTLVTRCPGCFFGHERGPVAEVASVVEHVGADVERVSVGEARTLFPALRFEDDDLVLHDRTAGVIAAEETMRGLAESCMRQDVEVLEETRVLAVVPEDACVRVQTDRGELRADRVVVTAGAWAGRLLPFLRTHLTVVRQTVAYFRLAMPKSAHAIPEFPVWAHFGDGINAIHWGLPEFGREGVKISRHVMVPANAEGDDPDERVEIERAAIDELREFARARFEPEIESEVGAETCLFTNTATEDYVIDLHPESARIAIGAGFSGHGFKLGPLTGRLLAELVVHGKTSVSEFESHRDVFRAQTRELEGP